MTDVVLVWQDFHHGRLLLLKLIRAQCGCVCSLEDDHKDRSLADQTPQHHCRHALIMPLIEIYTNLNSPWQSVESNAESAVTCAAFISFLLLLILHCFTSKAKATRVEIKEFERKVFFIFSWKWWIFLTIYIHNMITKTNMQLWWKRKFSVSLDLLGVGLIKM